MSLQEFNSGSLTRRLIGQAAVLSMASAATHVYGLVDQAFISRISEPFLKTHFYVDYLLLVYIVFGRIIGQALLVSFSKGSENEKQEYFSGALQMALITSVAVLMIFFVWIQMSDLSQEARLYALIMSAAGATMAVNVVQKFALIARGLQSQLLYGELIGNFVNLVGNLVSYRFLPSVKWQLAGIAASTLITQICLSIWYGRLNFSLIIQTIKVREYFARTKVMLSGEAFYMITLTFSPLVMSLVLDRWGTSSLFVGYNFGLKWAYFLAMPLVSLAMLGTVDLIAFRERKASVMPVIASLILAGMVLTGIPSTLFLLFPFLGNLIAFPQSASGTMMTALVLTDLIAIFGIPLIALSRAIERPSLSAYADSISTYLIRLPAFVLALWIKPDLSILLILLIVLIPELIRLLVLKFLLSRAETGVNRSL